MPTIQDVAARAGVSTATVSRALNASPSVTAATRGRVLQAMAELGYEPNHLARNLRTQQLRVFGLIISNIQNPFYTGIARGIDDAAREVGCTVMLCNSDHDPAREAEYLRTLRAERVAGVILSPSGHNQDQIRALRQAGTAVVTIDHRLPGIDLDIVFADDTIGTTLAIEHLAGHGHRAIGLVGGSERTRAGRRRAEAYRTALARLGLVQRPDWIVDGGFREERGYAAARALLERADRPRALFVANNLMALGTLRAARDLGLHVPDDLALIGFDDAPWAPVVKPPLTVVAQPTYELGRAAAGLLAERLKDPGRPPATVVLPTQLVVRGSCGPHA